MKVEFPLKDVLSLTIVDDKLTLRLRQREDQTDGEGDWKQRVKQDLETLLEIHGITCELRGSRLILTPAEWTQDILAAHCGTRQPVISELLREMFT